ncbi:protein Smaug isoform X2 [Drosophila grimshawi]|uniref:protein Smaug isoform X2 n=1 Tax=Drosophila grimshawi TaxID=7222 RepID=UPI000C870D7E|nr:protein Smaug isoform X2 [Drosophila grimshawi]
MKYTTGTDNALPTSSSSNNSDLQTAATITQQQQSATTTTSAVNNTTAATTNPNTNTNPNPNPNPTTSNNQTDSNANGGEAQQSATQTTASPNNALFCEQVTTVTNLFEKWNDCERTVVMYALLKRLRYPSLKFLQYSIDNNLTQNLGTCQTNLSSVVIDINANNPSYLQNLLSAYKTCQPSSDLCVLVDGMSSSSSDKDSMPCYGSDFQLTSTTSQHPRKEDLLHEVLNMLPLLKPGNEEAKLSYMTLIPLAVKDTVQQLVPTELVQQIFSYMFIHPAIGSDDRRSLNVWLRHLEDFIQANKRSGSSSNSSGAGGSYFVQPEQLQLHAIVGTGTGNGTISDSSSSSSSSLGNLTRSVDWQTIAPPSRHHHGKQLPRQPGEWRGSVSGSCGSINPLCDNLNGITLNELASSQNSLGLSLGSNSSLVNGVVAGAAAGSILGIGGNDDHDTSFSKNGTEILDFEPPLHGDAETPSGIASGSSLSQQQASSSHAAPTHAPPILPQLLQPPPPPPPPQLPYASILMGYVGDQFGDVNRWSLDSKIAALKTRRSNSLTTQTISSSCSSNSSNSSVITVNDNCSNSTENLAQFANKPRSFSLSIEHHRNNNNNNTLANSTSDPRLDDFKPSYIKFQTRNVGMSGIGLWLKSLRLHKYIELFKNMTYEEMLQISEEFLQSVGVTKGASHKLALCIEKLKERSHILGKVEQELHTGQMKISTAIEELTNIVLTPMKPLESLSGEENIGLRFLKVIDLVSNALQQDPYCAQDEETLGVFMWILDRSIHNEAFANHANQLKELKFKLSKLKMSMVPKLHHVKTTGGAAGNMNKPRWNGKSRKCDPKNGSNDRINHRKNSNDMLNFSLSCLQHPLQQHHQQQQQQQPPPPQQFDYSGGYQTPVQYKSSSYPSFISNPQQQQQQQQQQQPLKHHSQHAQQMQQMLQQQQQQQHAQHFPALPQQTPPPHHRRSLNNLIVVAGGPQQPQQLIFKPGQGVLTNSTNDNLQHQQQRKPSLNGLSGLVSGSSSSSSSSSSGGEQQPKKTMAAVVMENLAKFDQHFTLF